MQQYDVYWIDLEPALGSEVKKIRSCVIISPDEMNRNLNTIVICPATSTIKGYKCRVEADINGRRSELMLDHIRGIDKRRLKAKLGRISLADIIELKSRIQQMFVD